MDAARRERPASADAAKVTNRGGSGMFVILCDHASNAVPGEYGTLGLEPRELEQHIAWDPGALPVAERMAALLDAPLVQSCISRLVIDCNRPLDAPDLIAAVSEATQIPGNHGIDAAERERRIALAHRPFHELTDEIVGERMGNGQQPMLVSVHSFTPTYRGVARPWHVGILHDDDMRLALPLIEALVAETGLVVGDNQPYSPADRVYYTLERHGRSRGLPCVMIEIRNDEIADAAGQQRWAERLSTILSGAKEPETRPGTEANGNRQGNRLRA